MEHLLYTARLCVLWFPLSLYEGERVHGSMNRLWQESRPSHFLTLLGEALLSISPDEFDLHRQDRVHPATLRWEHYLALHSYENILHSEIDSTCRWCGECPETASHIFQVCPQLIGERVAFEVSSP